jgi:hypothetical protein
MDEIPVRPHYAEELSERIESIRMGLWWLLVQRSQGHLAHGIMGKGYLVLSFLERLNSPLGALPKAYFRQWQDVCKPFLLTLEEVHRLLIAVKANERCCKQVWNLCTELQGLIYAWQQPGTGEQPPLTQHTFSQQKEGTPCENAPSGDAENKSPETSSPADSTGSPYVQTTEVASGRFGTATVMGDSLSVHLSGDKKPSSKNTTPKKRRGHHRQDSPYTRKKGKAS